MFCKINIVEKKNFLWFVSDAPDKVSFLKSALPITANAGCSSAISEGQHLFSVSFTAYEASKFLIS